MSDSIFSDTPSASSATPALHLPTPAQDLAAFLRGAPGLPAQVRKRDGRLVAFDAARITRSLARAGAATGEYDGAMAQRLTLRAVNHLTATIADTTPSVEQVQDVIEEMLLGSPFRRTARAFIVYRDQHKRLREITARQDVELIDGYLRQLDWQVRENSNMSYSLQGLNNYLAATVSQSYWLNAIYPPEIRAAHETGDFHLHDLNQLSVYCVGWDLSDLLQRGFGGVAGKIESRPPRHLRSALGQIVNFFYTLQGEAAGAQAFSSFDTLLAPFIRFDGLDFAQVKQALQEFIYNVNVPTRVGFQTPFTNITLDLVCPRHFAGQPVVHGGAWRPETYGDFQAEMNLFNRAFFEVMAEGDAKGRVMTFPIPTINLTPDFDWDNPNLAGLWEMTGRYGIPYFSNFINSDMKPEDARSMCCRLRIDNTQLERRGGGLFGAHPLTGSVGVVTINLPRLGWLATRENPAAPGADAPLAAREKTFREKLVRLMDMARDSLETKRKLLERLTDAGLYPYTKYYLGKRGGRYWGNHFSTIGLVGMNEACANLGLGGIITPEGRDFALRTLDFMRGRLIAYQTETGNHYNLEATPAEGTSYRLAKKDKETCPGILAANEEDLLQGAKPFYTNSSHLPVQATDDLFEALDHQDELQTRYTGGTVLHLFLGERIADPVATKLLVRRIAETYRMPYFSLTPTFSVCPEHGYIAGEHHTCPDCGRPSEVYSRVVGYLRPVQQWNEGKQAEFARRRVYKTPVVATLSPGQNVIPLAPDTMNVPSAIAAAK
ncbi:ribonucleoside triphosphate reductase [Termitidicoccus mucosus]|uniref:Anaerobic ribonucleoside triphosphate reductase n=1 Tax=Termitidicoccus mucosus TaxID=1184151 RepID=A0A178IKU1_9BACT|nr:anaerobic ribonucleoside triphosphate reductase [Opitutaceae bacterium TSB47]